MEKVTGTLDSRKSVDIIYLDFAKAFDKVPYQRLFKKIQMVSGVIFFLLWIQSWLTGRRQRVRLNNEHGRWSRMDLEHRR